MSDLTLTCPVTGLPIDLDAEDLFITATRLVEVNVAEAVASIGEQIHENRFGAAAMRCRRLADRLDHAQATVDRWSELAAHRTAERFESEMGVVA